MTKCKVLVDKLVVNELLITQNVNHEAKTPPPEYREIGATYVLTLQNIAAHVYDMRGRKGKNAAWNPYPFSS